LVLVPAHLGNPRQSPEGCKIDVCVSVFWNLEEEKVANRQLRFTWKIRQN